MGVIVVCLSVTATFIPNEFLVTKVTEYDQVKDQFRVSIKLWYPIRVKLMTKAICTFLENVESSLLEEGVENFNFFSDIFNVMLDFIQSEARLLDMLDYLLLLL